MTERELIEALAAVLEERMTPQHHPYALVMREHRGTCPPRECSARCTAYRALLIEAAEYLAAADSDRYAAAGEALVDSSDRPLPDAVLDPQPAQLDLLEALG